jgi:hypothetical protein
VGIPIQDDCRGPEVISGQIPEMEGTMYRNVILTLIVCSMLTPFVFAEKKQTEVEHAPLAAKVLTAKTIFIQNDTGQADAADKAFTQLKAWGKYQVVDSKDKADLVLAISVASVQKETSEAHSSTSYNYKTGAWTSGTYTTPGTITWSYIHLQLIDATSGDVTWTDRMVERRKYSATQELIKSLQRRVEEQEKNAKP